jgi:hypothetical protein
MFKDGGQPLTRRRAVTSQPQHQGLLSLSEDHDIELRRSVRSARLCSELDGSHVVSVVHDVVVLWIRGAHMNLTNWSVTTLPIVPLRRPGKSRSWDRSKPENERVAAFPRNSDDGRGRH